MSNLNDHLEATADGLRAGRVAERAGAEHLGASMYELQPADEMVFHYHVQREELLIVLEADSASAARSAGSSFPKARSSPSLVASEGRTVTGTTAMRRCEFW